MVGYQRDHEYRRKEYFILLVRQLRRLVQPKLQINTIARFSLPDALSNIHYRNTVLTIRKTLVYQILGSKSKQPPLGPTKPVRLEASSCTTICLPTY